jgi:hypothetical protein
VVGLSRSIAAAVLALVALPAARLTAQTLTVDTSGTAVTLHTAAFSFLKGDPLARLKDGRSVRVELTALLLPAPSKPPSVTVRRIFSLSYDLWEERFAVASADSRSSPVSHLMLAAAEAWCIDQLTIPVSSFDVMGRDAPFWVRLDYRILDSDGASGSAESGYTLQALIDALSRRRRPEAATHSLEAGPFRLPPRD